MKKTTGIIAIVISIAFVLTVVGTAMALPVSFEFSGSTSDETDPGLLNAGVSFELSEGTANTDGTYSYQLQINVANFSEFTISELLFNYNDADVISFDSVSGADDTLNPELIFQQNKNIEGVNAGGYGNYDVLLDFYVKDKTAGYNSGENTGVGSGGEYTFYLAVTGTADLTVEDFLVSSSPELIAKFTQGPDDDSAFAAASIPEPGTMLLLGTGLVCLAGLGRKTFYKE